MRWLTLLLLSVFVSVAHAADTVTLSKAWVRLPAPGSSITAAYLTMESKQAVTLTKVASPAAAAVEMHSMTMKGDVMEMRQVDGIDIKPGTPTTLERGGLHLMLIDLKKPLKAGDRVTLTLTFKQDKHATFTQRIQVPVQANAN